VLPGFSDNPAFAGMFVAEAQISSRLVHPNIVSVLDFDRAADGGLFLVMELVDGKDLDGLVSSGMIPIPVMIFVITEVLRGLGYAHDLPTGEHMRGVVHRDVSPHNVLLSWEGAVKVSDFGIAKARSATDATASVFIKGKPAYMSPEQANGQPLDGRSDLFAVGVMMWEMLVGRRLFMGEDTRATLAAVLFGQIPRPRSLRGDIPKDLERVVMKLLERDLPSRYATAEAAITDLLDCASAPKNGREALINLMAERFPQDARVRQSLIRQRSQGAITPASPHAATIASQPGHAGTAPQVAAAAPSLSSVMQARTGTLEAPRKSKAGKIAAVVLVTGISGAATFAIVSATRGSKSDTPGSGTNQVASTTSGSDAGAQPAVSPPALDAAVDAPIDAPVPVVPPTPPPVDAGVPDAPKKDANPTPQVQAGSKKLGTITVHAFPVVTVYFDGKRLGDTPLDKFPVPVGKHTVRLTNTDSKVDEKVSVTITEGKNTPLDRMK
jgi:serine/threonine protein kinase